MNQLLDSLHFEPSGGTLSLQSARYLMIRPMVLVDLQKSMEAQIGHEAGQIIAQTAAVEGASLAGRYRDAFGYPPEQVLGSVAFMLSESGWGAVSIEMMNLEGREMVFKVLESPFAEPYGPSTQSVCYFLLGTFQGIAMALFESEASGMEVQCEAKGDNCCRFVVSA